MFNNFISTPENSLNNFIARPNYYPLRRLFWKVWYNRFASNFSKIKITFINYGYADLEPDAKQLKLSSYEEEERYCIQLYHHVANSISLTGLDVLEVGCGRGGGSSYMMRYLHPKTMTAVDFSESNIAFCQKNHSVPQLNFQLGDAEFLPFNDYSFDVLVNVESSHCYGSRKRFFAEAFRVIRTNGYFLFADFRPKDEIDKTTQLLQESGFKILNLEKITANVIKAMDLENERKLAIINQYLPKYLHIVANWFAGCQGTPMYEAFMKGDQEYLCYVLKK
ncbi:class I SAM-dependent methyltransferase [Anabaena sp. WFMT]|uniref:class I SAM-dependent methyltransferase n=1 Tax=Anabaena sp. WFMT TaxID=3449730 RepID=UPI003F26B350